MKNHFTLCLLIGSISFALSSSLVAQGKLATVELANYSKMRLGKPMTFAAAKLTNAALSASVQGGKAVVRKGFILCKVSNSNSNLPNFMILPERLLQRTSKIDIDMLMSESGLHGIRLEPGPISVITCNQCSDKSSDACEPVSEDRDDGRKNVYCSGCCNTRRIAEVNSLAIPTYAEL